MLSEYAFTHLRIWGRMTHLTISLFVHISVDCTQLRNVYDWSSRCVQEWTLFQSHLDFLIWNLNQLQYDWMLIVACSAPVWKNLHSLCFSTHLFRFFPLIWKIRTSTSLLPLWPQIMLLIILTDDLITLSERAIVVWTDVLTVNNIQTVYSHVVRLALDYHSTRTEQHFLKMWTWELFFPHISKIITSDIDVRKMS